MMILKAILGIFQILLSLISIAWLIFAGIMISRSNQDEVQVYWIALISVVFILVTGIIFCLLNGVRFVFRRKNLFHGNKWLGPISYVYTVFLIFFFSVLVIETDWNTVRLPMANSSPQMADSSPLIGETAPDVNASDISGHTIRLSDFRGKYVLLDFWATWCNPCITEMPNVQRISEQYSKDKLIVIGVSLDKDKQALLTFLKKNNISFPQIYDKEKTIHNKYNVTGIPMNFLIDPNGIIIAANLRGRQLHKLISNHIE